MVRLYLGSLLLVTSSFASSATVDTKPYEQKLNATIKDINAQKPLDKISKEASALVEMSKPLLKAFKGKEKECAAYIDAILKVGDQLSSMPLEKIESDYHEDKALPKAPGSCHHAKDLIVHPATVVALGKANLKAKDKDVYQKMLAELVELSAHLKAVEASISQPKKS